MNRHKHPSNGKDSKQGLFIGLTLLVVLFAPTQSFALKSHELLLIANRHSPDSVRLAGYYRDRRQIPNDQLLKVSLPLDEECSRDDYNKHLVAPLRRYLEKHGDKSIRCLVLFFGIPLRISAPSLTELQLQDVKKLKQQLKQLQKQEAEGSSSGTHTAHQKNTERAIQDRLRTLRGTDLVAAVDSELALIKADDYPLEQWQKNPFFVGHQGQGSAHGIRKDTTLFVSRLDGPSSEVVKRVIDDSLAAEQAGLDGVAYFDARWSKPEGTPSSAYALYDASLHHAAAVVDQISSLSVVVNQAEALFQPGEAPNAAIYSGWYSLGRYVDAFDWQRGAVAYHIASSECTTLKKDSRAWCKSLLDDGVAATIGPVAEPYVQGFPLPELFFSTLLDGYYTLVESYFLSLPYLSWRMVLIGDPLYRPFRNH